jgi:hypothetical protein
MWVWQRMQREATTMKKPSAKHRGRQLDVREALDLCLIFDDAMPVIEEAITGESTDVTLRGAAFAAYFAADHKSMAPVMSLMESGKRVMERMAADNPLVEPAKKYDLKAVSSILERAEYKAVLAEPGGLAFLLCSIARDIDTLAKRDRAEEVAEVKEVARKVIVELAEPIIHRRRKGKVGGDRRGERNRDGEVLAEVRRLRETRGEREIAGIVAAKFEMTPTNARRIMRKAKIN